MEAILIDSQPYDSYVTVAYADSYLAASLHASTDWSGASDTTKAQALITATRILDRQRWKAAYDTQAERILIPNILYATVEMALALVQGSGLQSDQSTAQQLQSITAGSVSLTWFRGSEGVPLRFPLIVWELLRDYLAGTDFPLVPRATGVDGVSLTSRTFGHTGGI